MKQINKIVIFDCFFCLNLNNASVIGTLPLLNLYKGKKIR